MSRFRPAKAAGAASLPVAVAVFGFGVLSAAERGVEPSWIVAQVVRCIASNMLASAQALGGL